MVKKYSKTISACYLGYIVQAIVNNFLPLLFVFFNTEYNIPTYLITFIVTYNFAIQILEDYLSPYIILKFGYRTVALLSDILCALGLIVAGFAPILFTTSTGIYVCIMVATTLMAVGGGFTEVIISPMVEALPLDNKSSNMSLLHSFYCVGHMFVVAFSTIFFMLFGIKYWPILTWCLALIPIVNCLMFTKCEIFTPVGDDKPVKKISLFKNPTFIFLLILIICSGAAEQAIAQWISFFAENGLQVSKSTGDLIGTLVFAFTMLISRLLSSRISKKINISKVMLLSSICLTICYILSVVFTSPIFSLISLALCGLFVGVAWPGSYSMATECIPAGGTIMFSLLAFGGDIGCTLGPTLVGLVSSVSSIKIGIGVATVFPILMITCVLILKKRKNKDQLKSLDEEKNKTIP